MEQFEKVCKGLHCHSDVFNEEPDCEHCEYDNASCGYEVPSDALSLIRQQQERIKELEAAQTARVMTLEEVKNHNNKDNCVWFELRDIVIIPVFVRQDRQETNIENPCILSDRTIPHLYWKNIDYCKKWRCWAQRPTDEQRKTVKWDD